MGCVCNFAHDVSQLFVYAVMSFGYNRSDLMYLWVMQAGAFGMSKGCIPEKSIYVVECTALMGFCSDFMLCMPLYLFQWIKLMSMLHSNTL